MSSSAILAILVAVAVTAITGSDVAAVVTFVGTLAGLLTWRTLALRHSRRVHDERLRAIAAWETANAGKPRHLWSPLP